MITLGITGGIGSGKSTVSRLFSLYDVPVYIADTESKRLVATSPVIREKLTAMFGNELFEGGVLNKALLAAHIFNDREKLEKVNAIIHPEVAADFARWQAAHSQYDIVAQEAAILFESEFNKYMDKVVMVYTPLEMRIERTMKRDGVGRELVMERIKNQMSDEKKAELSDFVVVNDGTQSLIGQVAQILHRLKSINK
ncbi:dephospho-CoA kinase [Dysgonomonas sp. BGC7]|uniref:dephospho-CoA kinase n=1 Tax=Dysgonomonas sp. BGC7 TaxID=1658008 RepID=UPI0006825238|nr:dephospho-CoA kinase [Dysgonomonas sp. BGC7]MBD8388261.1 dephospho-CoA kinase [Dysgonomonas sp. BGC7]